MANHNINDRYNNRYRSHYDSYNVYRNHNSSHTKSQDDVGLNDFDANYRGTSHSSQRSSSNHDLGKNSQYNEHSHIHSVNLNTSIKDKRRKTEEIYYRRPFNLREDLYQQNNQSTKWNLPYDDITVSKCSTNPKSLSKSLPIVIRLNNLDPKITARDIEKALEEFEGTNTTMPEIQVTSSIERGDNFHSFYSDLTFKNLDSAKRFLIKFPYITIIGNRYTPVIVDKTPTEISKKVSIAYNHNDNISSKPSKILIVRNIPKYFTPEDLQNFFQKRLSEDIDEKKRPSATRHVGTFQNIQKFIVVYDRYLKTSSGFGFLEFSRVEDSSQFFKMMKSNPNKLHVNPLVSAGILNDDINQADQHILIDFIHLGVFLPVHNQNSENRDGDWLNINNSETSLMYRDSTKFMRIHNSRQNLQEIGKGENSHNIAEIDSTSVMKTAKTLAQQPEKIKKRQTVQESSTRRQLLQWQVTHQEIHNYTPSLAPKKDDSYFTNISSLCDPEQPICLLCMRRFNNLPEVDTHERLSELHNFNKSDYKKLKRAVKLIEVIKKCKDSN